MAWSWMGVGSGWTSPSQKDLTPQPLESTWADPHMVVVEVVVVEAEAVAVVQVVLAAIHVTTTVDTTADTTVDTTEVATIVMTTGTTTDHTDGDLHPHTTEGLTGLGPDRGLILPVAIERCRQAPPPPTHRQEMFLSGMIDFRIDLLS